MKQNPCRVVLLTGGKIAHHDYARGGAVLAAAMTEAGMSVSREPGIVPGRFDAAVLYSDGEFFDEPGIAALVGFVESGGGLVGLHTAAGTNGASEAFGELIGSRIVSGVIGRHCVEVSDPSHPIAAGIEPFDMDDEFYELKLSGQVRPFLQVRHAGRKLVQGYSRTHGQGRVAYLAHGHSLEGLRTPAWARLFVQAVRWVCGRD